MSSQPKLTVEEIRDGVWKITVVIAGNKILLGKVKATTKRLATAKGNNLMARYLRAGKQFR